ncbi:MAG: aminotransferase class I/II-fold pyridoxal phosphate-dependent enzyme [Bacteroidia bacterium]
MSKTPSSFSADDFLSDALAKRMQENSLRSLQQTHSLIDFCSNDYYGLARSLEFAGIIEKATAGLSNGSGGSRLLAGNTAFTEEVEHELAQLFNAEAALIFNSGYTANAGFFQAVAGRNATILYDELIHASVRDGIRLSNAKAYSFRHNDIEHLQSLLGKTEGLVFVAAESVYSMDGDCAPLEALVNCCEAAGANLVLDEAHGTGVFWPGMAAELGLEQRIFARLHTFGKAAGVHGAVWLGSELLRNYLINFSRAFIYTTALPPHAVMAVRESCRFMAAHPELRSELRSRIRVFGEAAKNYPQLQLLPSQTPVQALLLPGNERARGVAESLRQHCFDVRAVLAPTVPEGTERIRICLHIHNSDTEINDLIRSVAELS